MNTSIEDWKTTKWKGINVEQMDIDCKKFAKDVRSLDKEMKAWDAFVGLDSTVRNMITSLRAVSELQNPAIRDRHWQQLMQATQVLPAMGVEGAVPCVLPAVLQDGLAGAALLSSQGLMQTKPRVGKDVHAHVTREVTGSALRGARAGLNALLLPS